MQVPDIPDEMLAEFKRWPDTLRTFADDLQGEIDKGHLECLLLGFFDLFRSSNSVMEMVHASFPEFVNATIQETMMREALEEEIEGRQN